MKLPIKERAFSNAMIILATIVVIVLAAVQYSLSNQISEATSNRLADSLQMSMINWHLDFFRDFSEICIAMHVDPEADTHGDWNQYARRFAEWKKTTSHPELISDLYIVKFSEGLNPTALRLNPTAQRFEQGTLSPELSVLRQELRQAPSQLTSPEDLDPFNVLRDRSSQAIDREFAERFYSGGPLAGWRFEAGIPALVRPLASDNAEFAGRGSANPRGTDWIVIALNEKTVQDQLLPDLAQRYFRGTEGLDYQVAVVAGDKPRHVLYSSDAEFGEKEVADADGTMNIFGRLQNKAQRSPIQIFQMSSETRGPASSVGIAWFPLLNDEKGENQDWRLVLRHRRGGPLGTFIADSRRRNLAISFGVLFLLVVSMAILIVTSTRAQRLAKLQMDFVTAVSHELRTPLTVISSAAENLAYGVVEGKQQLEQYGSVIGNQARKLFEMVEQILLFAAIREGHQRYSFRSIEVTEVVDAALSSTAGLVRTAGFRVEQDIEQNLPRILGDASALSQCMQNLITNALKYGTEQRWIGVKVRLIVHGLSGKEIQVSVADRGIGIDQKELPHIFEPFYRSPSVTGAQIHGTGLGLPLAKSIVEAMQGHLTVKSVIGRGSTFTLHLPCLEQSVRQAEAETTQALSS
jgi:signal transduction histidine kinase